MATPEEISSAAEEQAPLELIIGGRALDQQVSVTPVARPEYPPFESLMATLNEPEWADMSAEELLKVREAISGYRCELALFIFGLTQEHDKAHQKLVRINGFIRDRG